MSNNSRNKKRQVVELWESLEIPKYNWDELGKTGNLRFLVKDVRKFSSKHLNRTTLEEIYYKLMDEFFILVGDDPERDELMSLKKELIRARCLYALGDGFQANWIKVYEGKIQVLLQSVEEVDPDETLIRASKWLGYGIINTKEITVNKWVKLLKTIEKENIMLSKQYGKGDDHG